MGARTTKVKASVKIGVPAELEALTDTLKVPAAEVVPTVSLPCALIVMALLAGVTLVISKVMGCVPCTEGLFEEVVPPCKIFKVEGL